MAASSVIFDKIEGLPKEADLQAFCNSLLPLARQEYDIFAPAGLDIESKVRYALTCLDEKYIIRNKQGILGIVGRRKISESGVVVSCLFASATELILKYIKDYVFASKLFISKMSSDSNILAFSFLEEYDRARALARKLGFKKTAVTEHNGHKIITKTLRCKDGMVG